MSGGQKGRIGLQGNIGGNFDFGGGFTLEIEVGDKCATGAAAIIGEGVVTVAEAATGEEATDGATAAGVDIEEKEDVGATGTVVVTAGTALIDIDTFGLKG